MIERIKKLIANGENQEVEFKRAKNDFPKDAFETICAFLNSDGGTLILGVENNGEIVGVNPDAIDNIKTKFVTSINNSEIINPIIYLDINDIEINGKTILYINVPNASNVYRYKSRIYKRNHEADIDITNIKEEVAKLYLRTDNSYSENQIYPYLPVEELRQDLIAKVKKIAKLNNAQSDWDTLDTKEFLRRNKLYINNYATNQEGVTLAGVLLFGTDEQIASVAPAFKFELAKIVNDTERYDDRITLTTNLIDCLKLASEFIEKHLPSPFYLEGTQRINLRNNIFREIIANMLVHKEYATSEPTKLLIKRNEIIAENSNRPYIRGLITLKNTINHSKNPNIVRIFRAIGYAEDFGTGIPKLFKYCKAYTGFDPIISDGDIFKLTLKHDLFNSEQVNKKSAQVKANNSKQKHINEKKSAQVSAQVNKKSVQVIDKIGDEILTFCKEKRTLKEIMQKFNYQNKGYFKKRFLNPLIEEGLITFTNPDSPNSPNQKYIIIKKGVSND